MKRSRPPKKHSPNRDASRVAVRALPSPELFLGGTPSKVVRRQLPVIVRWGFALRIGQLPDGFSSGAPLGRFGLKYEGRDLLGDGCEPRPGHAMTLPQRSEKLVDSEKTGWLKRGPDTRSEGASTVQQIAVGDARR